MEYFKSFYKNERIKKYFSDAIYSSSRAGIGHAYIIEGPVGSGKLTFVRQVAALLECECEPRMTDRLPCEKCRSCHNIISGNSPDLAVVEREGASIGVDAVRKIKEDIYLSSTESEYKVYAIREAERLTEEAQNALLIFLEEPPKNVIIFLLTSSSASLLETVRSRAVTLRMQAFSNSEIVEYLEHHRDLINGIGKTEISAIAVASGGSIGGALALLDPKTAKRLRDEHDRICREVSSMSSRARFSELYDTFAAMPQKREELAEEFTMICSAISDLIAAKKASSFSPRYYYDIESAKDAADHFSLGRLVSLYELLSEALQDIAVSYANIKSVISLLPYKIKSI